MKMHEFSKTAEIREGKSRALSLKLAFISLFAASALAPTADARETLGLWTFNGESGTYACANKEEFVFSNHVERADSLRMQLAWTGNATASTEAPLYTNDVQYAYLFDGVACTNMIAECSTSAIFRHDNWANTTDYNDGSWNKAHSFLTILNVGVLIKDCDWTLEMIAHLPRRHGWANFIMLRDNIGNRPSFRLRTNGKGMCNYYSTQTDSNNNNPATLNLSYPKYDETSPGNEECNMLVGDDRWHHFAVKWSETEKTLYFYVDYALADSGTITYWSEREVNLQLQDSAKFVISDLQEVHQNMPTIQAVRLTRGDLSVRDFLCTSKFRNPVDTVAHWRFDGEPGETVQIVPEFSMPNRTDLQLWKHLTNDFTVAFAAAERAYVRDGGSYSRNTGALGWSGRPVRKSAGAGMGSAFDETRTFMNVMRDNPALTADGTGDSFTHEMFVCCRTNNLYFVDGGRDRTLFFGEGTGIGGFSSYGTANWIVSQERSGTEDKATIMFKYTYQDDALANDGILVSSSTSVTTNEWHHLAVTYNALTRKVNFYVDYKTVHENVLDEGYHLTRGTKVVGAGDQIYGYLQGFDGAIDEWRISRRALAPSEFLKQTNGLGMILSYR